MKGGEPINKTKQILITVGSGLVAGVIAALIFGTNSMLVICAIFAGFIAYAISAFFQVRALEKELDDLNNKFKTFGGAVMEDFDNITEEINKQFEEMTNDFNSSIHDLGLMIMTAKFGPEDEEDTN